MLEITTAERVIDTELERQAGRETRVMQAISRDALASELVYLVAPPCIIRPCFIMTSPIAFIISPRIWSVCAIIFGSAF